MWGCRGIRNFDGKDFLPGEGNLRRCDLGNSNLFQSKKKVSVNTEHQLKSKSKPKEYEIKSKMEQEQ